MGKKISGGDIGLMIEPNPAYIKALVQKRTDTYTEKVYGRSIKESLSQL